MQSTSSSVFKTSSLTALSLAVAFASIAPAQSAEQAVIDVLVLYTQGVENRYSGDPTTRINHLLEVSNQVFVDSDVNVKLSLAHARKVSYTDANSAETALSDMTYGRNPAFADVAALREQYKADMVILYRPLEASHGGSCGLAWLGGSGTKGDMKASSSMAYSHVGIDACPDFVTVHELGHNLGLRHSRVQDKVGGTFPYALGYGVSGKFVDIMAYASSFKISNGSSNAYKFSNPLKTCMGLPCGISRNASNGADAAFTLNITGPQVANYFGGQTAALVTEFDVLNARLDQSSIDLAAAQEAKAAQILVDKTAALALVDAKKAVTTLNAQGGKPFAAYQAKVKALASAEATLVTLGKTRSASITKYNAASASAKATAYKAYQTADANYNKQVAKIDAMKTEVAGLASGFASLISSLEEATATLSQATATSSAEKAKLATLTKAAATAQANHKTLLAEYNAMAKKLAAAGQVVPKRV